MKMYIRKVFPHDVTHEVSINAEIMHDFFNDQIEFQIEGVNSGEIKDVTINNATDRRFGGQFKQLLTLEGGIEENDLIVIYKKNSSNQSYKLEIIKVNSDDRYEYFSDVFVNNSNINERHLLLYGDLSDNNNLDHIEENTSEGSKLEKLSRQIIYFGAPGTGKSYQLKNDSKLFGVNCERVTFHPSITYGQFVGVFKPFPIIRNDTETITYKYIPGPLIKQVINALLFPENKYLLIIEELNRANVASVFGDTFQLLDRSESNDSEYPINISEDLQYYLENEIYNNPIHSERIEMLKRTLKNGLIFPKNMYLWATMNSADQGVMPLDTAFKRRWELKYFDVNNAYD